jgi:copper chaperone CopZ
MQSVEGNMIELKVTGMTCGGCVNSVKRAINREFPEADVQVDLDTGLVRVQGQVDAERAALSIKNAGFEVVSAAP